MSFSRPGNNCLPAYRIPDPCVLMEQDDYANTLENLGLVPSAVIMITK